MSTTPLSALDPVVGITLLGTGLIAWRLRSTSRTGPLLVISSGLWFLGYLFGVAVYLHRGPMMHAIARYPNGRLGRNLISLLVAAGYALSVATALTAETTLTLLSGLLVAIVAAASLLVASGPDRQACRPQALLAIALGVVMALSATNRRFDWHADQQILFTYDTLVALLAIALLVGLRRHPWGKSAIAELVTSLDASPGRPGGLARELGRAVGDASLQLGYLLPGEGGYVDDLGRPVDPHPGDSAHVATPLDGPNGRLAILVHDPAVLDDESLAEGVLAATRIAITNARLQADVRERMQELEVSRRRIIEAADLQRARLVVDLEEGPEQHLAAARARLEAVQGNDGRIPQVIAELDAAIADLRGFARGVRPTALDRGGLAEAVAELAARSAVATSVSVCTARFAPAVESTLYFICSEALSNTAKHAHANGATVSVTTSPGWVTIDVQDDGGGGAHLDGLGLRHLADRVEALGGRLGVTDRASGGTHLSARVPIRQDARGA